MLQSARSLPAGLLPIQEATDVGDRAAPAVADRIDPGIHVASRGTYGYRRIRAELTMAMGVPCSSRLISVLMTRAGIYRLPGPTRVKRLRGVVTAGDLVNRKFHRLRPNELWVTDITEHPTREGKVFCAAVLDAFSRRIIGWSIDSRQDSALVINALDMALRNRRPEPSGIVLPIMEFSSPHGLSATRSVLPDSCHPSEVSATDWTTR